MIELVGMGNRTGGWVGEGSCSPDFKYQKPLGFRNHIWSHLYFLALILLPMGFIIKFNFDTSQYCGEICPHATFVAIGSFTASTISSG